MVTTSPKARIATPVIVSEIHAVLKRRLFVFIKVTHWLAYLHSWTEFDLYSEHYELEMIIQQRMILALVYKARELMLRPNPANQRRPMAWSTKSIVL